MNIVSGKAELNSATFQNILLIIRDNNSVCFHTYLSRFEI